MRVLTRKQVDTFKAEYPDSGKSLDIWYQTVTKNRFDSPEQLQQVFGKKLDIVVKGFVFDISGNKYRLAASIHFNTQMVYIREIMTHAEYSKDAWKQRHQDFH